MFINTAFIGGLYSLCFSLFVQTHREIGEAATGEKEELRYLAGKNT